MVCDVFVLHSPKIENNGNLNLGKLELGIQQKKVNNENPSFGARKRLFWASTAGVAATSSKPRQSFEESNATF